MPGQVTHFYLASRVAESYGTASDPTLNAVHLGFKEILAANKKLEKDFETAIAKDERDLAQAAVNDYRKTLVSSDDIAIFSAFCTGAVGPDIWTIPNSTIDTIDKTIHGEWYFDMGHYNLAHIFPEYTLNKIIGNKDLSNIQKHFQKAYIFGYLSHIALDILAHLKVNVFAGAYHNLEKIWKTEQGFILEAFLKIFNNHNKVEHYLDAYVRFFCFEGYHPDTIGYTDVRKNHFGQDEGWRFPNYRDHWKKRLKFGLLKTDGITNEDCYFLDLSTSLAGAFTHRYKNGEKNEKVTPFIRGYFWDAYKNSDNFLRSDDQRTLHPDNFKDKDRPEEWVKLKFFSFIDDIWWNDLNDDADTQYYYLHTIIPDLEKVNANTNKFYYPQAFGHFIQGAIPLSQAFINDAVAYLNAAGNDPGKADRKYLNRLRFWNLDTGQSLRVRRNVKDEKTGKILPACIDILSVLDDDSLSSWTAPTLKEWDTLDSSRQKEWDGLPQRAANEAEETPPIKVKAGDVKKIKFVQPVEVAVRVRNTCFYEGDKESEIAAWILGNDTTYDENTFAQENEKECGDLYAIGKADCIEDSDSWSSTEIKQSAGRTAKMFTGCFYGTDPEIKKSAPEDTIVIEPPKRPLPRYVKISTARKWVFFDVDSGNFDPDTGLNVYKSLYPAEDVALAIFALIRSGNGYVDSMHDRTFTETDLESYKKVKIVGVNVILMIFEVQEKDGYTLTRAWIDGEEVDLDAVQAPPSIDTGDTPDPSSPPDTDTPDTEDDLEGPVKTVMRGLNFDTNKCFLLPSAIPSVKKLSDIYDYYTKVNVLIVGHTDTSGEPDYNRTLSVERAQALRAYLTDDWKQWYDYYSPGVAQAKRWGNHEDLLMIRSMPDYSTRSSSENEIVWYQRTRSLVADGIAGPKTRENLIKEYMNIDNTTLPKDAGVLIHGCGESHPVVDSGDGKHVAANRRVEIFFFPDAVSPAPRDRCPDSGCSEYQQWLNSAKTDVVLDDDSSSTPPVAPPSDGGSGGSTGSGTFVKPAREVHTVFLHCSASDNPAHDSAAVIDGWHKANGWSGIGYHYFVRKNGMIEKGRDIEKIPAAQSSHNPGTIAICAHGLKRDKFTGEQLAAVKSLCTEINDAYSWALRFRGHCEVANKTCPVYDYKELLNLDNEGYMQNNA